MTILYKFLHIQKERSVWIKAMYNYGIRKQENKKCSFYLRCMFKSRTLGQINILIMLLLQSQHFSHVTSDCARIILRILCKENNKIPIHLESTKYSNKPCFVRCDNRIVLRYTQMPVKCMFWHYFWTIMNPMYQHRGAVIHL